MRAMTTSLQNLPLGELLDQLAAKTPAPGGGAAACAAGALAASLGHMVVAYSIGKKSLAAHQEELDRASRMLQRARAVFLDLADEDARAYALVNELMRLPEADPRRTRLWPEAVRTSTQIPLAAIAASADLLRLCETLAPITNPMLRSDLGIAAVLAHAAAVASRWNVLANASTLPEGERLAPLAQADAILQRAADLRERVERACGRDERPAR